MKKFLTVLLVIAVMFTFSFGSAFAVTGSTYTYSQAYNLLDETASDLVAAEKVNMEYAASQYNVVTIDNVDISKSAAKEVFQDLYDDYCDAVYDEVKKQKDLLDELYAGGTSEFIDGTTSKGTETFDTAAIKTIAAPSYAVVDTTEADKLAAVKAEFKVVKANQLTALGKIDTTVYSTTKPAGASETPAQAAERLVAQAIAQVNGYTVGTSDTSTDVIAKITYIKNIYTAGEGTAPATGALAIGGTVDQVVYDANGINGLTKTSNEVKDNAKLEYAQAKVLATLTAEINAARNQIINGLEADILAEKLKDSPSAKTIAQKEAQIEDTKADYARILEVVTYYVNYQDDYTVLADFNGNVYVGSKLQYTKPDGYSQYGLRTLNNVIVSTEGTGANVKFPNYLESNMVAMAKAVEQAKADAQTAKDTIDIAGETYVEIDNLLEDAIEDIYINGIVSYSFSATAEDYLYHYVENKLIGTSGKVRINTVDYDVIGAWNPDNYDNAKKAEVKAVIKDAKAAVRAAATVEEAQAAFLAAYEKLDAIPTAAQHAKDFNTTYKAKYDQVVKELTAYAGYKNDLYNANGGYAKNAATTLAGTYTAANTGKFYAECFNDTELDAMLVEAKAAIDSIKTKDTVKAEAADLTKEIDALPKLANVTISDKDTILAVYDKVLAHNKYCSNINDNTNTVRTGTIQMLVGKIADLEEEAITDAYAAIMKDGKVSIDEASAVEALRAAYDAYEALWTKDGYKTNFYNAALLGANGQKLTNAEAALLAAQVKEVARMVNALPATGASNEAVSKVVAAFEALGRDGKDMLYHSYVREYSKLVDLQKLTASNVEALKITASSTAKKGSITVKWTVKGDTASADGYQIYRSTKKNSGFGTKPIFTTTKQTYKNTKGLKKGTRYYYKVRAYKVVDGKKLYSDWSNKAYRVAK